MQEFLERWNEAALTSLGFFWMALWAFALGYLISSLIQVLVTRQRMQQTMGHAGAKSMALATFFGFISSSCSFSALATTRALFQKGAGLAPAMAFLLASTNLVIELGIVIAIFLSWQFIVGEYVGGILLILFTWLFIHLTKPEKLVARVREKLKSLEASGEGIESQSGWLQKIASRAGWQQIGQTYVMEWQMVWKDVLIGFTIAGVISSFVPKSFFQALFIGAGNQAGPGFLEVVAQTLIGPVAAFFTFIGSMGNIPLAAVLFDNGVSFAGVMAFIYSDLVVFPVLRINAGYYGWRMALFILAMLLTSLIIVSVLMHYGFMALDLLPSGDSAREPLKDREFFQLNYTFILNILFLAVSALLAGFWWQATHNTTDSHHHHHHEHEPVSVTTYILRVFVIIAIIWLAGGLVLPLFIT